MALDEGPRPAPKKKRRRKPIPVMGEQASGGSKVPKKKYKPVRPHIKDESRTVRAEGSLDRQRRDFPTKRPIPTKRRPTAPRPSQVTTMGPGDAGILENAISEAAAFARGTPGALFTMGKALVEEAKSPESLAFGEPFDEEKSPFYKDVAKPQLEYLEGRYVDPFRREGFTGGLGEIARDFEERPLSGALDFWAAGSLASAPLKAAGRGMQPRNLHVKPEGSKGYTVHPVSSPNWLTKQFQDIFDRYSERHPSLAVRRGEKIKAQRIRTEQDRTKARAATEAKNIRRISFDPIQNIRLRKLLRYEAELPPAMRTVEGLQAMLADVRRMQTEAMGKRYERPDVVEMVPVSSLSRFATQEIDKSKVAKLVADIRKNGLRQPLVIIYGEKGGNAYLGEGNHRLAAAIEAGLDEVPVRVSVSGKIADWHNPVPVTRVEGDKRGQIPSDLAPSRLGLDGRTLPAANPKQARRLQRQINLITRAIETKKNLKGRNLKNYNAALESAAILTAQREAILIEAFGPEIIPILEQRRALVARRVLGDEAGPSDIFFGHRAGLATIASQKIGRTRKGPSDASTKNIRIDKENRLRLYEQGRIRSDPDAIIEDWAYAQTFAFHNIVKEHLRDVAQPIGPDGPNPGWYLFNPKGKPVPGHLKDTLDAPEPDSIIALVEDYVQSYIAHPKKNPKETQELIRRADDAGDEVLQLDPAIVNKFFNRYVGPQGAGAGLTAFGDTVDLVNGLVKASLLYANPGYYPAALAGALIFAGLHQGPFLPINLVRSGKTILSDPDLARLIRAEVGEGALLSLTREQVGRRSVPRDLLRVERGFAQKAHTLTDVGPRMAAWYHEARKAGYKSRESQVDLLTNKAKRQELDQIKGLVEEAMVNFELLGPTERALLGRMFFVWPWIRGAARWAYRWPMDRPVRAALLYGAAERFDESNPLQEGVGAPSYLDQAFQTDPEQTGPVRTIINPAPFSTIGTPYETFLRATSGQGVGEMLNPLFTAALDASRKQIDRGDYTEQFDSYQQAILQHLKDLSPLAKTIDDVRDQPDSTIYADQSKWDIIKRRFIRFTPIDVKKEGVHAAAARESDKDAETSLLKEHQEFVKKWEERFGGADKVPTSFRRLLRGRFLSEQRMAEIESEISGWDDLPQIERDYHRLVTRYSVAMELYPDLNESRIELFLKQAKGKEEYIASGLRTVNPMVGYDIRYSG